MGVLFQKESRKPFGRFGMDGTNWEFLLQNKHFEAAFQHSSIWKQFRFTEQYDAHICQDVHHSECDDLWREWGRHKNGTF